MQPAKASRKHPGNNPGVGPTGRTHSRRGTRVRVPGAVQSSLDRLKKEMVEERTCELEDRSIEINQKSKEEEDRGQRDSLRALWNMKQSNTHVTGIPGEESRRGHEREEKGKGTA